MIKSNSIIKLSKSLTNKLLFHKYLLYLLLLIVNNNSKFLASISSFVIYQLFNK